MALTDMEVFNTYFMPATIETLAQMVDKFNAASNGAIVLTTEGFDGDFMQESFYKGIHNARRRVDRYATNTVVTPIDLTQDKHTTVKVAGGFGPVRYEPSQLTWLRKPTAEGIEVASRNFAEALLQDQLNTAIAALVAAIGNQPTAKVSAAGEVTYARVNQSHALFGDHSASIVAQVMNGLAYHSFIGQNLVNGQQLFQAGNVRVIDILGRPSIVTDAPALAAEVTPGTPTDGTYSRVLSLVPSAAVVHDNRDIITNIETTNGKERIETTLQMDYTFAVGLKGYSWDETNGGKSPTDAELATGSNWDNVMTSIKHTAGVMAEGIVGATP